VRDALEERAQAILRTETIRAVQWREGQLLLLDQRRLHAVCEYLAYTDATEVAEAIRAMVVRGAPAIGVAAAYAVVLAAGQAHAFAGSAWQTAVQTDLVKLRQARPTAVNLHWAIDRMQARLASLDGSDPVPALLELAITIHEQDLHACRRMGQLGAELIGTDANVMTHCNAGALATGGYGTALGVIRAAHSAGKLREVFVDETRPWLQGARLTAWELLREGIPATLIADGAAAFRMQAGGITWVIVGADRIAANGDVANKIGTYGLALSARAHGVKVMVVAPVSTFDTSIESGLAIPIEQRDGAELTALAGQSVAVPGVKTWNPVFDVTPALLVDVIVTERGVIMAPDAEKVRAVLGSGPASSR
jgi:methylthioribose-1-phosphate isomerase